MYQYDILNLRQQELLAEAEKDRLISSARKGIPGRQKFLASALAWWGNKLSHWGQILQDRYGNSGLMEKTRLTN
jgi:hypothetical protein